MYRIFANYAQLDSYNVPCFETALEIAAGVLVEELNNTGVVEVVDEHDCLVYTISRF